MRPAARGASLAALAVVLLGTVCEPGAIRVTNRPPDPVLVDAEGAIDPDGVDALARDVERERGLGFIQRPTLEPLAPGDARIPALLAAADALEPCPRGGEVARDPAAAAGRCFVAESLEWIECVASPDLEEARRALRRLLDAQNYPRLARAAPRLPGDPGVALRALLAASANGSPARSAPHDALDLFALETIEVERRDDAGAGCVDIAAHFLGAQEDREAPMRRPPLSTKELVSPARYRAGERPRLLLGAAPRVAGCEVAADESVGVARLLVELLAKGGSIPGDLLAAWQGDRAVRFACEDARSAWIYVAELADAARAAAFAAAIPRLLPAELAAPATAQVVERRVVVSVRAIEEAAARAWAAGLDSRELAGFRGLE